MHRGTGEVTGGSQSEGGQSIWEQRTHQLPRSLLRRGVRRSASIVLPAGCRMLAATEQQKPATAPTSSSSRPLYTSRSIASGDCTGCKTAWDRRARQSHLLLQRPPPPPPQGA